MEDKKTTEAKPEDSAAQIPSVAPCYVVDFSLFREKIYTAATGSSPVLDGNGLRRVGQQEREDTGKVAWLTAKKIENDFKMLLSLCAEHADGILSCVGTDGSTCKPNDAEFEKAKELSDFIKGICFGT